MISAMGLFLIGYYWGNQYKYGRQGPPAIEGVLVRPALEVPAFELTDASGLPFTDEDLKGHWTLLVFGELSQARGHLGVTRMIEVDNRLADHTALRRQMQLVLAADAQSPKLARDFSRLSPRLRVVSGEPGELQRLRTALGEDTNPAQGEATLFLFGPAGRLMALFTATQSNEAIAADISALSKRPTETAGDSADG
jgi:protein SCO1/2